MRLSRVFGAFALLGCLALPGLAYAGEDDCDRPVAITRPPHLGSPFAHADVTRMDTQTSDNVRMTGGCISVGKIAGAVYLDASNGVKGDGTTADHTAIQALIQANLGKTIYGIPGKTYRLAAQMFTGVSSLKTIIDCRGAAFQYEGDNGTTIFTVGGEAAEETPSAKSQESVAQELAGNVEIRNCIFRAGNAVAFKFNAGSKAEVHHNQFYGESPWSFHVAHLATARVASLNFHDNYMEDVRNFVWLKADSGLVAAGSEVLISSPCSGSPADGTTWAVPAERQAEIAAGYAYYVRVEFSNSSNNYLLFGPYHGYTSADTRGFSYDSTTGCFTFNAALDPTASDITLYIWNPQREPANDIQNLSIINNTALRVRDSAVQLSCTIYDEEWKTPYQDCPRGVRIIGNRFTSPYQTEGMVNNFGSQGNTGKNWVLYSRDYTNAVWVKTRVNTPTTGIWAPPWDYQKTAQKITESTANGTHLVHQVVSDNTSSANYTGSFILKAAERQKVRISIGDGSGNTAYADVNLKLMTVTGSGTEGAGATNVGTGVQPMGMGWARYWVTINVASTTLLPAIRLQDDSGSLSYTGTGTSGVEVWDTMLESGDYPSMPKPTLDTPAAAINNNLISLNGVNSPVVIGNVLGPCADQCLHLEDSTSHGTITGNVARDFGSYAYSFNNSQSYTFTGNTAFNGFARCFNMFATENQYNHFPAVSPPWAQNLNLAMSGNTCDGYNNPAMTEGYRFETGDTALTVSLNNPPPANLPVTAQAYAFARGRFNFQGPSNENLLINPGFDLDQRREGATAYTASAAAMDGWKLTYTLTGAGTVSLQRSTSSPPTDAPAFARLTMTAANTGGGGNDFLSIEQRLTGDRIAETAFGTTEAKSLAASWMMRCSVTGTRYFVVHNDAPDRSYVHPFIVNTADEWEYHYAVIPGDTTGTWVLSGADGAMRVRFVFGAGTSRDDATANVWVGTNEQVVAPADNTFTGTLNATCDVTNVKLEVAQTPTNLRRGSLYTELSKAQQFYRKTFAQGTAPAQNVGSVGGALCTVASSTTAGTIIFPWRFDPPMRAAPTVTTYNPSAANENIRHVGTGDVTVENPLTGIAHSRAGIILGENTDALVVGGRYCVHVTADSAL